MALRPAPSLYQHRGSKLETGPSIEPVTVDELCKQLREDDVNFDTIEAGDLIQDARTAIENHYGVAMITQTWRLALDRWPGGSEPWWDGVRQGSILELHGPSSWAELSLPVWPLQTVDSVTTYDQSGASTAVTVATVFDVDTYRTPGRMRLKAGQTWPTALRALNAIEIVYTSGYGPDLYDVPAPMRRAVKQLAAFMYEHRGDGCSAEDAMRESGAAAIMGAYKVKRL